MMRCYYALNRTVIACAPSNVGTRVGCTQTSSLTPGMPNALYTSMNSEQHKLTKHEKAYYRENHIEAVEDVKQGMLSLPSSGPYQS